MDQSTGPSNPVVFAMSEQKGYEELCNILVFRTNPNRTNPNTLMVAAQCPPLLMVNILHS
jgi:hypothetical protein